MGPSYSGNTRHSHCRNAVSITAGSTMKRKYIFISIITVVIVGLLVVKIKWPALFSAKTSSTHNINIELKTYDLVNLYQDAKNKCQDAVCFEKELQSLIPTYGPTASLEMLQKLQNDGSIAPVIDDHQIAHRLGRETAKIFGLSGQSFLLCPTSYNYGCQHGFFEYVLGRTGSTKEAAAIVCGSIEQDHSFSSKFKFYCYHGLGHGILMAQAYDLKFSLDTCDSLPTGVGQEGCWQGVFMENVNGGLKGESRKDIFSNQDPLAPCNVVDDKYRHQCFINHAGWLMRFFNNNVAEASRACLEAPTANIAACLESIGLMATNPSWQHSLLPNSAGKKSEQISKEICDRFPASHRQYCIIGAVDNIMNFNDVNISKAAGFCDIIDEGYQALCYRKIGADLRNQTVDNNVIIEQCSTLEDEFKNICLDGAGLN